MKYLAIIATRDFENILQIAKDDFIAKGGFLELGNGKSDKKLLIWRQTDDESSFVHYTNKIVKKINNKSDFELGVIFHDMNGDAEANKFRESLKVFFNSKLAFCEWYSSTKIDFWNEHNRNTDLPYNNLKKAWKDNNGDKEKTFEAVWDYFMIDTKHEELLKPFEAASPYAVEYKTKDSSKKPLKEAKIELQTYVREYLKNQNKL